VDIGNLLVFFLNISLITGIVGTIVVLKKMSSVVGSISHSLLASVSLANILKVNPIITSVPFVIILSMIVHAIRQNQKINEETALSIMWVIGVSIGIMLISLTNVYSSTVSFYLFGNILFINNSDIILSSLFSLFLLIFFSLFNKEIKNLIVDEEYSKILGINVNLFSIALLSIISLSIVFTIKAVGIILLIAIFTIPPLTALKMSNSIEKCMTISFFISLLSLITGYYLAYSFNLPISSTITLLLITIFLLSEIIENIRKRGIVWKTKLKET